MADKLRAISHTHDTPAYSRPTTPVPHPTQIGFVGLGAMGYLMARNLAIHKTFSPVGALPLLVWNRSVSKSENLVKELGESKVKVAASLAEIAKECDVIFTSLSSDEVVTSVYQEFVAALRNVTATKNKIFVETSTIYPSLAGALDNLISSIPHAHLVTSPVFGAPTQAENSQLLIIMSGDYRSKKEVAYMMVPAIGRKIIDLGGNLEKGNSVLLGALEILGESLTLAEKCGIGAHNMHQLIKEIMPAGPFIHYGDRMANDDFDGTEGFAINGGIQDASHIRRLTTERNAPMPLVDLAHQHMITARALYASQHDNPHKTLDWSAMVAANRVAAGLDGFDSEKHTKVVREE